MIHGLTRFCMHSMISLRLSNIWTPYDLASLSIWNSLSSLCANISSGAGENLMIWHHMIITIPAELWGHITHILVYLWGLLLAGYFLVQRMRHNRNRRPYELRIYEKCDWHSVQDEEHILLDCPHELLVSLRTQHRQLVFPPKFEDIQFVWGLFWTSQIYIWCGLYCGWVPSPIP